MDQQASGGQIATVTGIAQKAGLQPGDRLLSVNGHHLRDLIDFRFYADGPAGTLRLLRAGTGMVLQLRRPANSDWGIEFTEPLFDRIRRCTNRCLFCFLDQLPAGWRRSLYLRDDDYRLSFLYGNFVTLSNLRPEDWDRLAEQRLSPLYVSVHATEAGLRRLLLGRKALPDIRRQLACLGRLGITVHTQVVLCPGINDGRHLERTVADLAGLPDAVHSVGVVPVGVTRFRVPAPAGLEGVGTALRPYTPAEAQAILQWAAPRQRAFRRERGRTFLYLADEFYLLAGWPLPSARLYDGFPQLENGIGLVRGLLDDWQRVRRRLPQSLPRPQRITLVSGTLAAPLLERMARELAQQITGLGAEVLPVPNVTFGPTVTVAGLLTAEALRAALQGAVRGDILFLPQVAFDAQGRTLDGVTVQELEKEVGRPILLVERMGQVVRALQQWPDEGPSEPSSGHLLASA